MSTLSIVHASAAVLWQPAARVEDIGAQVLPHLDQMIELMRRHRGIGLAAPQVGLGLCFFVTDLPGGVLSVVVNPEIVSRSKGHTSAREGCLSFPDRRDFVRRPDRVGVRFTKANGVELEMGLTGWDARVFQHETDHLSGVVIFSRPPAPRREAP